MPHDGQVLQNLNQILSGQLAGSPTTLHQRRQTRLFTHARSVLR